MSHPSIVTTLEQANEALGITTIITIIIVIVIVVVIVVIKKSSGMCQQHVSVFIAFCIVQTASSSKDGLSPEHILLETFREELLNRFRVLGYPQARLGTAESPCQAATKYTQEKLQC